MQIKINSVYQSVFGNRAVIDVKKAPKSIRKDLHAKLTTQIKKEFSFVVDNQLSSPFRYLLRSINARELEKILYGNNTDELAVPDNNEKYQIPSEHEIANKFIEINEKYHFFTSDDQKMTDYFAIFFKAAKLFADYIECNNTDDNRLAYLHAYKMLVLFGAGQQSNPFSFIERYLSQHNFGDAKRPLHDALLSALPSLENESSIHLNAWRKLIKTGGPKMVNLFKRADAIERELGKPPANIKIATESAAKLLYSKHDQYPELAELCATYLVPECDYNECLEIDRKRKQIDHLPNVLIKGEAFGYPGTYIVKLPKDDPRGYILGEITNCCQSIGGVAEDCVKSGMQCEHNGFYVLLRRKKNSHSNQPIINEKINYQDFDIIGQGYAWLSYENNLVFDSWENKERTYNPIIVTLLIEFAKEVVAQYPDIMRITIGVNGRTPTEFKSIDESQPAEIIKEGVAYSDSKNQHTLYLNQDKLEEIRLSLKEKWETCRLPIKSEFVINKVFSTRQAGVIERVLLNPQYTKIWLNLFGKNIKKWTRFIAIIEKHSTNVWTWIETLEKVGLLNEKNLFSIPENASHTETIKNLELLNKYNFLTKINFKLITKLNFDIETVMAIHSIKLLTKSNYKLIKKHPKYAQNIIGALLIFNWHNLSNRVNIHAISNDPKNAISIARAFVKLNKHGLLTKENYKFILSNPKFSYGLSIALKNLSKANLLTTSTRQLILENAFIADHFSKELIKKMASEVKEVKNEDSDNVDHELTSQIENHIVGAEKLLSTIEFSAKMKRKLDIFFKNSRQTKKGLQKADIFCSIITTLSEVEFLSHDSIQCTLNLIPAISEMGCAEIINGMTFLYESNALTLSTFRCLFQHEYNAGDLAIALCFIHKINLSNNALENLVKNYSFDYIYDLGMAVNKLQKNNLFTPECLSLLENKPNQAKQVFQEYHQAIKELKYLDLLTQTIRAFICEHFRHAHSISQGIVLLNTYKIASQDNIQLLLNDPEKAKKTAEQLVHDDVKEELKKLPSDKPKNPLLFTPLHTDQQQSRYFSQTSHRAKYA